MVQAVAGDGTVRRNALEAFARDYWPAIYAFARKKGNSPPDAEDLTQSFLLHLIDSDRFDGLSPDKGRFRSWLLACLHNFLRSNWRDQSRQKRGGGMTPVSIDRDLGEAWLENSASDELSPDRIFDKRWATGIMERALEELSCAYQREGREELAEVLIPLIAGAEERPSYTEAARKLGISDSNARVAAFRMRKRLRSLIRDEVGATVSSPMQVDAELAELFTLFSPPDNSRGR
jgi:RNA polymerase sigma-70 factor (ECF subfamily)